MGKAVPLCLARTGLFGNDTIDAVSGAAISSSAVTEGVNSAAAEMLALNIRR
ncbi:MAG: FMN-binding protein [Clostridia bacterium]|nr:FMN-binding protein [Clostridia bacterium]